MNAKIVKIAAKAVPVVKKLAPVIVSAGVSAYQAFSDQKAVAHVDDLEKRIKDLEMLFKK